MNRSIVRWQIAGFLFTSILGTFLHFLFELSGQSITAALFSAVNESIWEHMKLLYFPMLAFAALESRFLKPLPTGFWCVKLIGILTGLILIPVLYYTYTGILGKSADWFNVTIFFIAAAVSFRLETGLFKSGKTCPIPAWLAIALLLSVGAAFVILAFTPPQIPLFRDPVTGTYGYQGLPVQ